MPSPDRPLADTRALRESTAEATFLTLWKALGYPAPDEREYRFSTQRMFRFDFAWPAIKVAVEVEGGTWTGGRHVRGQGYENDCVKYWHAIVLGWTVFRLTTGMIERDPSLYLGGIQKMIEQRESLQPRHPR